MEEFDLYIIEATRVRRAVVVYSEMFASSDSVAELNKSASRAFSIIQRSMHDEILMSLSRLFDGSGYKSKGSNRAYLSQYNLVSKYDEFLDPKGQKLKAISSKLLSRLSFKSYRDLKVAHNDKETLLTANSSIKHEITSRKVLLLLDVTIQLMLNLKTTISKSDKISIPVNLNDKYDGVGTLVVNKMKS